MKAIVAIDENFGIGRGNRIPWDCPEDLIEFSRLTRSGACIMGTNTYRSLPRTYRPLPQRLSVVLTRPSPGADIRDEFALRTIQTYAHGHTAVCEWHTGIREDNIHPVQALASTIEHATSMPVWCIGGAWTYEYCIDWIDTFYVHRIKGVYDCDTTFPTHILSRFTLQEETDYGTFKQQIWNRDQK